MKGNEKLISVLNELLADELTAINQYMVHSEMCANWGYDRLHHAIEKRAMQEMKHAEMHIARILFLEGTPVVSKLKEMHIGANVENQFTQDCQAERDAIVVYNNAIKFAMEVGDHGTREMLDHILKEEEAHLDWLEAQIDQINQIGLKNYLLAQIKEEK